MVVNFSYFSEFFFFTKIKSKRMHYFIINGGMGQLNNNVLYYNYYYYYVRHLDEIYNLHCHYLSRFFILGRTIRPTSFLTFSLSLDERIFIFIHFIGRRRHYSLLL